MAIVIHRKLAAARLQLPQKARPSLFQRAWSGCRALLSPQVLVGALCVLGCGKPVPAQTKPPAHLRCEAMEQPLGIDITQPRLSWWLQDERRGARQTAYEIRVSASEEKLAQGQADIWDSGRVESDQSVNVPYAGPALESRRRYYWEVRVWDQDGQPSPYSAASWWEMGLLSADDWKAQWITRFMPIEHGDYVSSPKWIWAADDHGLTDASEGKHEFRFHFDLPQKPKEATLLITAKDNVAAWINGKQVLEAAPLEGYGPQHPWGTFQAVPVAAYLEKGANVIAAEGIVEKQRRHAPQPAGLIALLRVRMPDGKIERFVSGPEWKTSSELKDTGWTGKSFDDSAWPAAAAIASVGEKPFGRPWPALPPSLLRRAFRVAKKVVSARIYSSALGSYQLYLNGQRVGHDVLAPGWTDYSKRIVYQSYDVSSQLRQGGNVLGAILGGGWYADGLTWVQTHYNFGPPPVRLLVQLEIHYSDGTRDTVFSDASWKVAQSPILLSSIYNGEKYDARLEQAGWDAPGFDDSHWEPALIAPAVQAPLVAQDFPPIREHETLTAKAVTNPAPGVYIFDLGQNMVGWARLRVSGRAGTQVRLRFGEVLQNDGQLYTENLRTAQATDLYTLRGKGQEVFQPHFTFHGFRYVEVTGYPGAPPRDAVEGIALYTDAPFTMQFKTGNAIVDQLWGNILWGQRGNFLSVPTDCPQRDERLGWMGDAEVFWRTAAFDANLQAFSRKFTADIRDAQQPSGAYTDVSPFVGSVSSSVAGWADAGVIIPWTAYLQYADVRILQENWEAMNRWMAHLENANPNHLWLKERGNDYGDWLAIGSETPKDLIATAYWACDASIMRQVAEVLGQPAEAEKYRQLFEQIRAAFDESFVKNGVVGSGSQTSYVLALHMDLVPQSERAEAAQKLVDDIKSHDWHLTTGFLGTPYLLLELSKSGHSDVAYRLLLQTTYPSWGYMIEHGATTMWERWNGNQMLGDPSMNSFNHYAYGAVAEWLYRYAAGIDEEREHPGFHRIVLHPQFSASLGQAQATYDSPAGVIVSGWKAAGDVITWNVSIPANTTALLHFPSGPGISIQEEGKDLAQIPALSFVLREAGDAVYRAEAGSYKFTIRK